MNHRFLQQLEFIKFIDKLKYILRKTRLINSDRHENDAEHSWHLAMMAIIFAEHANEPVDVLKVLKMVLIHDIVEIEAGDTFLFDTAKDHVNTEEELIAAKRIFGMLPEEQTTELIAVWEEFEAAETPEAKFAKALDRFEPVLQNVSNNGGTWTEFQVKFNTVYNKLKVMGNGSHTIWCHVEKLLKELLKEGVLK